MKIALFGGSFNPPHLGHISMLNRAIKQLSLDKVIVMPCGNAWHKDTLIDGRHRLAMTRLAFGGMPVEVSSHEIDSDEPSYTVDTVKYLLNKYPNSHITLIIGGDSYRQLSTWHNYLELLNLVDLAVYNRDKSTNVLQYNYPCTTHVIDGDLHNVSSTEIRVANQFGMDISSMVSPEVTNYITHNNIYGEYKSMTTKLRDMIDDKRYNHSYHTTLKGLELSGGARSDDVFVACALHDCAKSFTKEMFEAIGIVDVPNNVAHAFAGAIVARNQFGITNNEMLDSIYYHTTGRAEMTWLEKIVYLADKLEATRKYPTAHLYGKTLDETLYNTIVGTVQSLERRGISIYYLTKDAELYYNQLTKEN